MNMTSEDTAPENAAPVQPEEAEAANYTAPAMDRQKMEYRMRRNFQKLMNDPENVRRFKNWQRAQDEFRQLVAIPQEERSRLLFTGQCILMRNWNELKAKGRLKPRLVYAF